ncbi:MAG: helix-hairpin-helix domain-containing protein [Phycisphaeraceae bacterium]
MAQPHHPTTLLLVGFVAAMCVVAAATRLARPLTPATVEPRATGYRINLNTADADTLTLLPRIGPSLAHRIVEYRQQHGRFRAVDQLDLVRGIGPRTVNRLRAWVTCEADAASDRSDTHRPLLMQRPDGYPRRDDERKPGTASPASARSD